MARTHNRSWLGKGLEFIEVYDPAVSTGNGLTHVVRAELNKGLFIIDSHIDYVNAHSTPPNNGIQFVTKDTVAQVAAIADKILSRTVNGKRLIPFWISNGLLFSDDCFKPDPNDPAYLSSTLIKESALEGSVMQMGVLEVTNDHGVPPNKQNRFYFAQNIVSGKASISFGRNAKPTQSYTSFMSGAGLLVRNGAPISRTRNGWTSALNGSFSAGQTFCSGPVIAANRSNTIVYLINDITHLNNYYGSAYNSGRDWAQMAQYLTSSFPSEIGHPNDQIWTAITFDGGASRGLWVRGGDLVAPGRPTLIPGYSADRPVPHMIVMLAEVPAGRV